MKKILSSLFISFLLFTPVTPVLDTQVAYAATDIKNDATLSTGLISFWELEEASGTRVDSHAANDLTDNNTVLSAVGIQGDGADFEVANSEYLKRDNVTGISLTNDFSISFWFKLESDTTAILLQNEDGVTDADINYRMLYVSSAGIYFQGSVGGTLTGAGPYALPTISGVWYHFVGVKRSSGTGMEIYINGTSVATSPGSTANLTNISTNRLMVGSRRNTANANYDGVLDEMGIWNRVLSTSDISALYNSGAGIPYDAGGTIQRRIIRTTQTQ